MPCDTAPIYITLGEWHLVKRVCYARILGRGNVICLDRARTIQSGDLFCVGRGQSLLWQVWPRIVAPEKFARGSEQSATISLDSACRWDNVEWCLCGVRLLFRDFNLCAAGLLPSGDLLGIHPEVLPPIHLFLPTTPSGRPYL